MRKTIFVCSLSCVTTQNIAEGQTFGEISNYSLDERPHFNE